MAEATFDEMKGGGGGPNPLAPVARAWRRVSPSLVPVLAVVTALIITIPLMIVTRSGGNIIGGLNVARTAYAALLEGSLGLAIDPVLESGDVGLVLSLAENEDLSRRDLLTLSRQSEEVVVVGRENLQRYAEVLTAYETQLTNEQIDELGSRLGDIEAIGEGRLLTFGELFGGLAEAPRRDVSDLAESVLAEETITPEIRELARQLAAVTDQYEDDALFEGLSLVDEYGIVRLTRIYEQLLVLQELDASDEDIEAFDDIFNLATSSAPGVERVRELIESDAQFEATGIDDIEELANQLRLVSNLYANDVLTEDDVALALAEELPARLDENLIVRRPGNRVLIDENPEETATVIMSDNNTPEDPSDDKPETVYLHLGDNVLFFFPASLESTLARAIPFIVAGLAVALGFKAGLFNIGAEGQLYIGAIFGTVIGYSLTGLPLLLHLPLVMIFGILGGALWGMIPGLLKAYTGAHEVINTIMLNFIAIRLVDWLIKSTDPPILIDETASTPRTPFILESAQIPTFNQVALWMFIAAALVTFLVSAYFRRERIQRDPRAAILPAIYGILVFVGGVFFQWINVRDNLHLGFVFMLGAVWFVGWFLERTTLGFELRTVGANPDAAKYAGMSVKWNIALAMTLSGALAGFAGMIEIGGVQHNMQPEFFAGLGFDSIAVALLARNNPRNMIFAGILWGALLTGAGLMQVRADISIDLVRIVQALIIMFIAADAIIRSVWAIPEATAEEKAAAQFSKGWGA